MSLGCKLKPKTFCISGLYPSLAPPGIRLKKSNFDRDPPPVGVERSGGSTYVLSARSPLDQYQEFVGAGSPIALKGAERLNKPAPTPREIHLLTVQDGRFEIVINPNRPSPKK
jgi:hypothetical protein